MITYAYETTNGDLWGRFIAEMHGGTPVAIDEEMYYYWLEVLPPVYMGRRDAGRDSLAPAHATHLFGFCEGYDRIVDFWRDGDTYHCRQSERMSRA